MTLENEARNSHKERMGKLKRIKTFKFDIDNDLQTEVLMNDQVFDDL